MWRVVPLALGLALSACGGDATDDAAEPDETTCLAVVGDECYDDERLERFFLVDLEAQGLGTDVSRACMAPGLVDLVRQHGFADVFIDRPVAVAGELNELRAPCGVD